MKYVLIKYNVDKPLLDIDGNMFVFESEEKALIHKQAHLKRELESEVTCCGYLLVPVKKDQAYREAKIKLFNEFGADKLWIDKKEELEKMFKEGITKCEYCIDLESMESVCPDEPHHGSNIDCDECGAVYYVNYGSEVINTTNEQARFNHPELVFL